MCARAAVIAHVRVLSCGNRAHCRERDTAGNAPHYDGAWPRMSGNSIEHRQEGNKEGIYCASGVTRQQANNKQML
jgi:hypothetical protein